MEYPFLKCLKPLKVWNRYTKEFQLVPCGKCVSCMNKRSSRNKRLCELEEMGTYNFTYFVTLTYNNESLPYYELIPSPVKDLYGVIDRNKRSSIYGEFVSEDALEISGFDLNRLNKHVQSGKNPLPVNCFSYLYYRDVQLFNKLLRKRIQQKYGEQIRYFVVGEYGASSFRAHWHIIYFAKKALPVPFSKHYLFSLWKKGNVDSDRSKGGCISYASSYINSAFALPPLYGSLKISPTTKHSVKLGYEVVAKQVIPKINKSVSNPFSRRIDTTSDFSVNGSVRRFPFDSTYQSSVYPRPFRFELFKSDKSLLCYLRAYEHYCESFADFAPSSVKQLTFLLYDYLCFGSLTDYDLAFCAILDISSAERLIYSDRTFGRLYRFLLYSKKILSRLRGDPFYLDKLLRYYDKIDYTNLLSQYEKQESYFLENSYSDDAFSLFYVSTFSQKKLESIQLYSQFLTMNQTIHEAKLSRKRFNDAVGIF